MTQIQENKLPEGWIETTLGEVCDKIGDGLHGTPKYSDLGIYYFINGNNIENGKIIIKQDTKKVTQEEYDKYKKELNNKTLLLSINGTIGNLAKYNNEKCILGKSAAYLNINDKISKDFIYYLMKDYKFQKDILKNANGSTIKNVSLAQLRSFPVILPKEKSEQQAIAKILSSFDDKIELLSEQNETLEKIGQELFKEWFGKYKVGDELPEGWKVGKLGDFAKLKSGFAFKNEDFIDFNTKKALKIKDLKGNGKIDLVDVSSISSEITELDRVKYFKLKAGDIVLAMSGNTTGKIGVVPESDYELFLNQRVGKFFVDDEKINSFLYFFLMSGNYEEIILNMGYGSAQPNINPGQIENIDLIIPDNNKLKEFLEKSDNLFKKVLKNNTQIQTLSKTRDELLPKLMKGEVRGV